MPLEDLIALGYQVSRVPEGMPPGDTVSGFGRQWRLASEATDHDGNTVPGGDEEAIVTEAKNYKTMVDGTTQALTDNQAFLALKNPTALQTEHQCQALTQQVNWLIRLTTPLFLDDTK